MSDESSINDDLLMDHNYDGIQEYDNPTPGWWTWLFVLSVIFSIGYVAFFHVSVYGWTLDDSFQAANDALIRKQFAELGELEANEATIARMMSDEKWMRIGESIFKTHCVSCHGRQGEGLAGPNLTDDHYKNVKNLTDIARVLTNGAGGGAMPPWNTRLHPNEIVLLSSYVASLRGDNLTGPRPAEGEVIPPWPSSSQPSSD